MRPVRPSRAELARVRNPLPITRSDLRLAIVLVLSCMSGAALAAPQDAVQNESAGVSSRADDAVELDKVEVVGESPTDYRPAPSTTSTGLTLTSRQTPQSVTVVTQQRIEDEGMQTVTDVVNRTTGISVNQYETHRAGFTARGFDITNLQIDGTPSTWDAAWSSGEVQTSLATFDRVEVVRGATGLMTGAGDPSAAINLVRKRADSKDLAATVELGYGRWNQLRMLGDVSAALNDSGSVRARVVGEYTQGDSWTRFSNDQSSTLFGTVEFDLSPATLLSVGISRQETDPRAPMWGGLPYWYSDSGRVIAWDRSATTAPKWARWNTEYTNAYARLEHRFDNDWRLRVNVSHGEREADSYLLYLSGALNEDGSGLATFPGSYLTHTTQKDIDLHVEGPFTLAGRTHEVAFGALYSDNDFRSDSRDAAMPWADVGNFQQWDGNYPEPVWSAPHLYETSKTRQDGLYAVARFSITDPLAVITGARLSDYKKTGSGLYAAPYKVEVDNEVTPYAGIVYDFSQDWSAYASYTDIFQPQDAKDIEGQLLDPIVGRNAEVGIKAELLDGRLNASAAVFRIEQDNLAQEAGTIDRGNGPEVYYRAAEGATSRGFEFEVAGELATGWNASVGYSQFKATDANDVDFNTIYPRKLLRLFTTYRLPGAWSALTIGGGTSWESSTYTIDPAAPAGSSGRIEQDAVALVNLMARYEFTPKLSAQLNIDNALDETTFGMFAAYNAITYGPPRSVQATVRYRF